MGSPVSRRIRGAMSQVAPVSRTSGNTSRRAMGSSRSFAELLADAEAVGGLIASRYTRPASPPGSVIHRPAMQPPGAAPSPALRGMRPDGLAGQGMAPLETALRGMLVQGMTLRPRDRDEKKSRPDEEPQS